MKKLVIVLGLVVSTCLAVHAQTIDAMEYFFDSDPGLGNGIAIPITPGPSHNVNISINTSGLTVGFHTLVIRAHEAGGWGIDESRVIYVASETVGSTATLGNVEYYIDTDPGPGNGTALTISSSQTSVNIFPLIATSSLTTGFHILHIRAMDAQGNWGIPEIRTFYVGEGSLVDQGDLVQLEYFFDTEPGYGAGIPLTITAGTQIDFPALINSAALSNGFHTISIRAKDADGQWGFAEMRTFYVDEFSQISTVEYYIDVDPGEGSATAVSITPGGAVDQNFIIPTASLTAGTHTLGIRAARTDGSWGNTTTSTFTIQEGQTITFGSLAAATYGDAPITLGGTSSSGLALTYTSSDPAVATISGSTVTIVGAGSTVITASQAGNSSFAAAPDQQQTLLVNKANQTITFGALTAKTVGDAPFTLSASSTSTLGVVYNSSNTAVATVSGNTVTIVGAGTTNITASQAGNGNYNAAANIVQALVVLAANNSPSIAMQPGGAFFTSTPVVINNTITISDADGTLASATVSITAGFQNAEDQLTFILQGGITGSYNSATGVLALSGAAAVADYQAVLRSVRYNNTATSPNTTDRTVSIQVNDGVINSNAVTTVITINKPPVIEAPEKDTQAGGNITFNIDDIFSDPDDNLDFTTLNIVSAQGALVTIAGGFITVNYSAVPEFQGTDQLTLTICDQAGKCQSQTVAVDVGADVEVFNGISANDDNMNDYMRIRFLPAGSKVVILNRWGDVVFEMSDYDTNNASKRFEGNGTDGNELTAGTYFYKISLPDGRERTGYLQLKP